MPSAQQLQCLPQINNQNNSNNRQDERSGAFTAARGRCVHPTSLTCAARTPHTHTGLRVSAGTHLTFVPRLPSRRGCRTKKTSHCWASPILCTASAINTKNTSRGGLNRATGLASVITQKPAQPMQPTVLARNIHIPQLDKCILCSHIALMATKNSTFTQIAPIAARSTVNENITHLCVLRQIFQACDLQQKLLRLCKFTKANAEGHDVVAWVASSRCHDAFAMIQTTLSRTTATMKRTQESHLT